MHWMEATQINWFGDTVWTTTPRRINRDGSVDRRFRPPTVTVKTKVRVVDVGMPFPGLLPVLVRDKPK